MIQWEIDTKHSEIHFKAKHMLISTVTGLFAKFNGHALTTDAHHFADGKIDLSIDVNSIYTNEAFRDEHLKSDSFFAAAQYPTITFRSTAFHPQENNNHFYLQGQLTIKNITKPVDLIVVYGGYATHRGNTRVGFQVSGKINRRDFGLNYNPLLEAGGMIVSEEVEINANIELIKNNIRYEGI